MNSIQNNSRENTPFVQLLMLGFYALVGLFLFTLIGFALVYLQYGGTIFSNLNWLTEINPHYLPAQRIMLIVQQIGLFLAPALLVAKIEGQRIDTFYGFKEPSINLFLIVVLLMVAAIPVLEWITQLNQKMVLPDSLKSVEKWMKDAEEQGMKTTVALLKMDHIGLFLINIGMIAVLPAIAEELMFRGALQRTLGRMFNNHHVAIWFSAFIFSAIHMQFYGFFPRLFLGATFGYLYVWSGSLWYAIFGHFINNGYAICVAWYMQKNNIPLSEADKTMNIAWYGYLISAILTVLLFRYFKKQAA